MQILGFCQQRGRDPCSWFCRLHSSDKFPSSASVRMLVPQQSACEQVKRINADLVCLPVPDLCGPRLRVQLRFAMDRDPSSKFPEREGLYLAASILLLIAPRNQHP
jgi:hypothetical protein